MERPLSSILGVQWLLLLCGLADPNLATEEVLAWSFAAAVRRVPQFESPIRISLLGRAIHDGSEQSFLDGLQAGLVAIDFTIRSPVRGRDAILNPSESALPKFNSEDAAKEPIRSHTRQLFLGFCCRQVFSEQFKFDDVLRFAREINLTLGCDVLPNEWTSYLAPDSASPMPNVVAALTGMLDSWNDHGIELVFVRYLDLYQWIASSSYLCGDLWASFAEKMYREWPVLLERRRGFFLRPMITVPDILLALSASRLRPRSFVRGVLKAARHGLRVTFPPDFKALDDDVVEA